MRLKSLWPLKNFVRGVYHRLFPKTVKNANKIEHAADLCNMMLPLACYLGNYIIRKGVSCMILAIFF